MTNIHAGPAICPACAELIITSVSGSTLVVPAHFDRITPAVQCAASARVMRDGKILQG